MKKRILIIGLGLIGGSLGMALKGKYYRVGWARRQETRLKAVELDAVDEVGDDLGQLIKDVDIIVIATPIPATIKFLQDYSNELSPTTIVTDIGSIKTDIVKVANENKVRFVGSHPMAGTEKSGIEAAFGTLFANADVFITPRENDTQANDEIKQLWSCIGAKVVEISSETHDSLVANTSHLLHILASALTLSVLDSDDSAEKARRFAGCATGFRDTSRIASSNPEMWRQIIEHNRKAVLESLDSFDRELKFFKQLIIEQDFDAFEEAFAKGKEVRDEWLKYKGY